MNYYLIDYENIGPNGLKNSLCNMSKNDAIIVFYSENCKNISIDVLEDILSLNLKYTGHKVKVGTKNALDFQLSSYLGFLIHMHNTNANYYIVSKDGGFDCLCNFWKEQGISIKRITEKTVEKKDDKLLVLENVLSKDEHPGEILKIMNQYARKDKVHNAIVQYFGDNKKGLSVYKKIKPLLK